MSEYKKSLINDSLVNDNSLKELPVRYVRAEGDSYQRGIIHGTLAGDLIVKNIDNCKKICRHFRKKEFINLDRLMFQAKRAIQSLDYNAYREIEGIARGAAVQPEDVILLNVKSELMNPAWMRAEIQEGCTTFTFQNKMEKGEIIIGQTWDWMKLAENGLIFLHCIEEDFEYLTITEAGVIANVGCNNCGVGVCLNYLSVMDINEKGCPYHILLHRALNSRSLTDAQRNLIKSPIGFAINVMLAHAGGGCIDYELTSTGMDFFLPGNRSMIHTNHFLSDRVVKRQFNSLGYDDSVERYETLSEFINSLKELHNGETEEVFTHYFRSGKTPVIKKPVSEDDYEIVTLFWVVFNLTAGKLYFHANDRLCSIELNTLFKHDCSLSG